MKTKYLWIGLLAACTSFLGSMAPAQALEQEFKRYTEIVAHRAYTDIYEGNYQNLENALTRSAFDFCNIQLNVNVISKPGLFRDGQHYGEMIARCYNPAVKDIALSFYVYPYDEESQSKLEIFFQNGDRKVINTCWSHGSPRLRDCDAMDGFRTIQPNFTRNQPPVR